MPSLASYNASLAFSLPMQEVSGTTAADVSGNSRTFTGTGINFATDSVPGPGGSYANALHLTDNTDYLMSASFDVGVVTAYTLAFRIKGTAHGSTAGYVLGLGTNSATTSPRFAQLDDSGGTDGDQFQVRDDGGAKNLNNGYVTLDGGWHSIMVVVNATNYKIYIDGLLWRSATITTFSATTNTTWRISSSSAANSLVNSDLCDVRFWTDDLDPEAVSEWTLLAPAVVHVGDPKICGIDGSWGTTIGDKDFTVTGLGGRVGIKAALVVGCTNSAAESGSAVASAHPSIGYAAVRSFSQGLLSPDGSGAVHAAGFSDNVTTAPDGHGLWTFCQAMYDRRIHATQLSQRVEFKQFITNGIRQEVIGAYSSKDLAAHMLLFAGDNVKAAVHSWTQPTTLNATFDVALDGSDAEELDFEPSLVIVIVSGDENQAGANSLAHPAQAQQTICFISNDKAGTVRHAGQSHSWKHNDSTTTRCSGRCSDSDIVIWDIEKNAAAIESSFRISFPDANTLRCTTTNASTDDPEIFILALDFGDFPVHVGFMDSPTSTGVQTPTCSPSFSFTPQMICAMFNQFIAVNTDFVDSAAAGSFGIGYVTRPPGLAAGNIERTVSWQAEHGVSTTNSQTLDDAKFCNLPDDDGGAGGDVIAAFDSFASGGIAANFTAVNGSAYKWPFFAVGNAAVVAGGGHRSTLHGLTVPKTLRGMAS